MRIGILQQNYFVGDCVGNAAKILEGYRKLCSQGVELVVTSELAILGYPPKDLLNRKAKVNEQLRVFNELREQIGDVGLILGLAEWNEGDGKPLFNNGVFVQNRKVIGRKSKELLPTYDVFDESRYFEPGPRRACVVPYRGKRIGLIVCEDSWQKKSGNSRGHNLYITDPVNDVVLANPDFLVIINASPYFWCKGDVRFDLVSDIAKRLGHPVIYVNQVGGNDELIFDGRSLAVNHDGLCTNAFRSFVEDEIVFDTEDKPGAVYSPDTNRDGDLHEALVIGVRDYLKKTGYTKVVIGESGGIDSALTTCIAVDAIGAENVTAIGMPSPFSSPGSIADSMDLCRRLGIKFHVVPIKDVYKTFGDTVQPFIGWHGAEAFGNDVTEENVQARIRGMILMAYSNRKGTLVLSTGNKSELAVGYCTLYGDMVGGLGVISDLPKTLVYRLANYVNKRSYLRPVIPATIMGKAPSAELRPGQKDQDSLPPYHVLDAILHWYVEEDLDTEEIVGKGFERPTVEWVANKVDRNEYKRRQGAIGLKVTTKAFGSGRRIPIAMKS